MLRYYVANPATASLLLALGRLRMTNSLIEINIAFDKRPEDRKVVKAGSGMVQCGRHCALPCVRRSNARGVESPVPVLWNWFCCGLLPRPTRRPTLLALLHRHRGLAILLSTATDTTGFPSSLLPPLPNKVLTLH